MRAGGTTPSSRAYGTPWGELTWSGPVPLLGFQSQFTDPATGAVATPARWYLPSLARFTSPDPLPGDMQLPLSLNRYAYALDDPASLSDPSGLKAKSGGTSPHCGRPCQEHALATAEQRYAEWMAPEGSDPAGRSAGADGYGDLATPGTTGGAPPGGADPVWQRYVPVVAPDCWGDGLGILPSSDRRQPWVLTLPGSCLAAADGAAVEEQVGSTVPQPCAVGFLTDGVVLCARGPDAAGRRRWPGWGEELGPDERPRPIPLGGPRNPHTGAPWFLPGRCGKVCRGIIWGLLVGYASYRTCQAVGGQGCR